MITIVYNDVAKAVEIMLDHEGADLLIEHLHDVKQNGNHLHLGCVDEFDQA